MFQKFMDWIDRRHMESLRNALLEHFKEQNEKYPNTEYIESLQRRLGEREIRINHLHDYICEELKTAEDYRVENERLRYRIQTLHKYEVQDQLRLGCLYQMGFLCKTCMDNMMLEEKDHDGIIYTHSNINIDTTCRKCGCNFDYTLNLKIKKGFS